MNGWMDGWNRGEKTWIALVRLSKGGPSSAVVEILVAVYQI